MSFTAIKSKFMTFWYQNVDTVALIAAIVIGLAILYYLMSYLEDRFPWLSKLHEKVSKWIDLIYNIWARLFAYFVFLATLFFLVTIVVKMFMFFWRL